MKYKRMLLCLLVSIVCAFALSLSSYALYGDVNNDGYIGVADSIAAIHFATGIETPDDEQFQNADVDRDGYITMVDVRIILRAAGAIEYLPNHLYSEWETQTPPTCTETGLAVSTCLNCETQAHKILYPTGHDIVEPTCTEKGYCKNCEDCTQLPLGHTEENGFCTRCSTRLFSPVVSYKNKTVTFGSRASAVKTALGTPKDTITDNGGEITSVIYVYYTDYTDLGIFTFTDGKLTQFFSNDKASYVYQGSGKFIFDKSSRNTTLGDMTVKCFTDDIGSGEAYCYTVTLTESGYYFYNKSTDNSASEKLIFHLTNGCRAINGVAPLIYSQDAAEVAQYHSNNMATKNFFSHTDSDGLKVGDRLDKFGVEWYHCSENIAAGYYDPYVINNGWYNSESHRKGMLNYKYKYLGVGIAHNSNSDYKYYSTQNYYNDNYVE